MNEARREYQKAWRKNNRDKRLAGQRAWRAANPDKQRAYSYRQKYGIDLSEVEALETAQDGCCKICQQRRPLVVDHDHETGRVRGLLCTYCNAAIGLLENDPEYARRAALYVEE